MSRAANAQLKLEVVHVFSFFGMGSPSRDVRPMVRI